MSWRDRIANAILGGKVGGPTPSGIHVYHSSPHDFDRFDLGKIGTGEGAQSYGHGIYAAENPKVSGQGGTYWNQFLDRMEGPDRVGGGRLRALDFDRAKAIESAQRDVTDWRNKAVPADPAYAAKMLKMREDELRLLESGAPVGPRTYEVNFKAQPEQLLDWDKPLTQQSPLVQDYLMKGPLRGESLPTDTGRRSYERLAGGERDMHPYVSNELRAAGIPGIRYLDEGSRSIDRKRADLQRDLEWAHNNLRVTQPEAVANLEGQIAALKPTYNYVAFDPSKLDIMAKYGVVGGVPLGALAATDQYGAQQ